MGYESIASFFEYLIPTVAIIALVGLSVLFLKRK